MIIKTAEKFIVIGQLKQPMDALYDELINQIIFDLDPPAFGKFVCVSKRYAAIGSTHPYYAQYQTCTYGRTKNDRWKCAMSIDSVWFYIYYHTALDFTPKVKGRALGRFSAWNEITLIIDWNSAKILEFLLKSYDQIRQSSRIPGLIRNCIISNADDCMNLLSNYLPLNISINCYEEDVHVRSLQLLASTGMEDKVQTMIELAEKRGEWIDIHEYNEAALRLFVHEKSFDGIKYLFTLTDKYGKFDLSVSNYNVFQIVDVKIIFELLIEYANKTDQSIPSHILAETKEQINGRKFMGRMSENWSSISVWGKIMK